MRIVLTYDVDRDHTAIKQACLNGGFSECAPMKSGTQKRLPNTTLFGDFDSPADAVATFRQLARGASKRVVIEKVFATACGAFILDSDEEC